MSVIFKQPWKRQPQIPKAIDWSNPLTRGLVGLVDPASGRELVVSQGAVWTRTGVNISRWYGARTCDSGRFDTTPRNNWRPVTNTVSLLVLMNHTSASPGTVAILDNYDGVQLVDRYGSGTPSFIVNTSGTSSGSVDASGTWSNTKEQLAIITADGTTAKLFIDGVNRASAACTGNIAFLSSGFASVSGSVNTGGIHLISFWNRALSQREIRQLSDNPWQLFAPLPRRIWAPQVGPPGPGPSAPVPYSTVVSAENELIALGAPLGPYSWVKSQSWF